jgi:hypothetical protein
MARQSERLGHTGGDDRGTIADGNDAVEWGDRRSGHDRCDRF